MEKGEGNQRQAARRWLIVALLACAQGVNQADKAVLGLAAEPIMRELGLSTTEYGFVAGSLFATFALGGMAIAFLFAPRFSPRVIVSSVLLVWSLSQLPIVLMASLPVLIVSRMVLGAGEGGGVPTFLNMSHEWFPSDRRVLPGAIILAGGTVGALLAAPALTYIVAVHGWRNAFLACAAAGAITMIAWLFVGQGGPYSARSEGAASTSSHTRPISMLLRHPTVIRSLAVGFCAYWTVGFTFGWLAPFVRSLDGIPLLLSGWILSLIYLSQGAMMLAVGGLSQRLLVLGHGPRKACDLVSACCLLGSCACFAAAAFVEATSARLVFIAVATGLPNAVFALLAARVSAVAPPAERYRLVAIVVSSVTIAALFAPPLIGALIGLRHLDGWRVALVVMAGVSALGAIISCSERTKASHLDHLI